MSDLATNVGNDHAKNLLRYWITRSLYQFTDLLVEHLGVLHPLVPLPNWPYHCQLKGRDSGLPLSNIIRVFCILTTQIR